jgi:hypothetical protein
MPTEFAEGDNPLGQSDEDFMNMNAPPAIQQVDEPVVTEPVVVLDLETPAASNPAVLAVVPETPAEPTAKDPVAEGEDDDEPIIGGMPEALKKKPTAPAPAASDASKDPKTPVIAAPAAEAGAVETFAVPRTIRANGKDIALKSEAEALQLMQMGANYTRKMQELKPQQGILLMLQNAGIADEGKLSFLIDLHNKNPKAIAQLVKDSGIDPLDIDTDQPSGYQPGNHSVSNEEANFRSTITELASSDKGAETVAEINTKWDNVSKEVIWKNPEIMPIIHAQRESGVYDVIVTEMDRRITLGQIQAGTPFLEAYKTVGDDLSAAALAANGGQAPGTTTPLGQPAPASAPAAPVPVATRTATPKPAVSNGDKAAAAGLTRSTPGATDRKVINPLTMSDDAFMKAFEGRL